MLPSAEFSHELHFLAIPVPLPAHSLTKLFKIPFSQVENKVHFGFMSSDGPTHGGANNTIS